MLSILVAHNMYIECTFRGVLEKKHTSSLDNTIPLIKKKEL
jgi:hypothetical protein